MRELTPSVAANPACSQGRFLSYVRTVGLATGSLAVAVLLLCGAVDPYGILGTPVWPGVTSDKPAAADHSRFSKPYRVEVFSPTTLLIGSSALNIGVDPDSSAWPSEAQPVYNLGIDGASVNVQRQFLMHALAKSSPKVVVFFVSFEDMLLTAKELRGEDPKIDEFQRRMRVLEDGRPNPGYLLGRLQDLVFATMSEQSVLDSLKTLFHQRDSGLNRQTASGFEQRNRLANWTATSGTSALLQTSFEMRLSNYEGLRPLTYDMSGFASMVRAAREHGANVLIAVQPVYAAGLELRRQVGLTEQSLLWLADLTKTAKQIASETGGLQHVTVWDFSGFTPYNQESMPKQGDQKTRLRWFYEAIHFRPELGALMISQMLSHGANSDFGQQLMPASLESQELQFRANQREWVFQHPEEVAEVRALIENSQLTLCQHNREACDSQLSSR